MPQIQCVACWRRSTPGDDAVAALDNPCYINRLQASAVKASLQSSMNPAHGLDTGDVLFRCSAFRGHHGPLSCGPPFREWFDSRSSGL